MMTSLGSAVPKMFDRTNVTLPVFPKPLRTLTELCWYNRTGYLGLVQAALLDNHVSRTMIPCAPISRSVHWTRRWEVRE